MKARTILAAILTCAAATALPACMDDAYVAYNDPPPPRAEIVVARPGFIWIHGHWLRDNGSWHWHGGYYERERVGQRYVDGHWMHSGNQSFYVEGAWRRS